MNKIVLIILSVLLFTNVAYATKYKIPSNINDYSIEELEVSSTENTKYQAKHKINTNYGVQGGKLYDKIKVNNKQVLKISSKRLNMLSFVTADICSFTFSK